MFLCPPWTEDLTVLTVVDVSCGGYTDRSELNRVILTRSNGPRPTVRGNAVKQILVFPSMQQGWSLTRSALTILPSFSCLVDFVDLLAFVAISRNDNSSRYLADIGCQFIGNSCGKLNWVSVCHAKTSFRRSVYKKRLLELAMALKLRSNRQSIYISLYII